MRFINQLITGGHHLVVITRKVSPFSRLRPRQELLPRPGPRGLRQLRGHRHSAGGGAAPHRAGAHSGDGQGAGDRGGALKKAVNDGK